LENKLIETMKEKKKTSAPTIHPEDESQQVEVTAEAPAAETPEVKVEDLQTVIDGLKSELVEAQAKADEYLDGWQRSRAEFANFRKRVERDQAAANQAATGNVLKRFLDVVDDLDRALKNRPKNEEGANWAGGIELIYRKLLTSLENEGVVVIQAEGQTFDPSLHEAISQEDYPDLESGQVIATVQQGYILGERVLRPARVRVAR
jgi:molecular chaperone GrpE